MKGIVLVTTYICCSEDIYVFVLSPSNSVENKASSQDACNGGKDGSAVLHSSYSAKQQHSAMARKVGECSQIKLRFKTAEGQLEESPECCPKHQCLGQQQQHYGRNNNGCENPGRSKKGHNFYQGNEGCYDYNVIL